MQIKLVAFDISLFHCWKKNFEGCNDVEVIDGDIFSQKADALVSPANSFGFMDGGLDLKISQKLGWGVEDRVRERIINDFSGEVPVGNALIVETGMDSFPYLISAPTMRVPMDVSKTVNAYLAFRAILLEIEKFNKAGNRISSIACPGLGTGEGRMKPDQCALQMREAYNICMLGQRLINGGLAAAVKNHQFLLSNGRP